MTKQERFLTEYEEIKIDCTDVSDMLKFGCEVDIRETNETGEKLFAVVLEDGFWVNYFNTPEEAEEYCESLGFDYHMDV